MIPVCRVEDVPPGEGRMIAVAGRPIALFRTPTGWYAIDHACPHAGGPLADGIASDCAVICPLHDRRFALDTGDPVGHDGPGSSRIVSRYAASRSTWRSRSPSRPRPEAGGRGRCGRRGPREDRRR